MNKKRRTLSMGRKYWVGLIVLVLSVFLISAYANSWEAQISNNVTLMVEIGVGIGIAIVVLGISRQSELYTEMTVKNMFAIIKSWQNSDEKRETEIKKLLLKTFLQINSGLDEIAKYITLFEQSTSKSQKEDYNGKINQQREKNYLLAKESLNNPLIFSDTFFSVTQIISLKTFFALCEQQHSSSRGNSELKHAAQIIKPKSEPWIKEFSEKLKNEMPLIESEEETTREKLKNEMPLIESEEEIFAKQISKKMNIPISISLDKTVYPLGGIVHIRFEIQSIKSGKKILYKVFNSNNNLLLHKKIDPTDYDKYLDSQESGIYRTSFTMEGHDWTIGETYTIHAVYGNMSADSLFVIDRRTPVIQSDMSMYLMGSDMIITVIDPDADKNSMVIEYVGNRNDSKLVIESPYGKINGYKLQETGKSTGIFQGIVRISGIRKNRSMIPQYIDGQLIDKIGGTGILDGCIGGTPGDELIATYTSKSGTARINFYISDFGAVIELDQKCYSPTDKVYITIIAPDFNFNAEKIDEIGEKPESIVTIRTSCDSIEKCRLIETGPDTGIFTGIIQLEHKTGMGLQSQSSKSAVMKLFCRDDDFIEISFMAFNDKKFIAEATIQ